MDTSIFDWNDPWPLTVATKRKPDDEHKTTNPPKNFKSDYIDTVAVVVGEGDMEKTFTIHKDLACSKSPFFQGACSTRWVEGQEGIIKLPTLIPNSFSCVAHWIYTNKLDINLALDEGNAITYLDYGKVWCAAHYLECLDLCDAATDQMVQRHRRFPTDFPTDFTFFPPGTKVRSLVVDILAVACKNYSAVYEKLQKEVVVEVLGRYAAGKAPARLNPLKQEECCYHEHEKELNCPVRSMK